MVEVRVCSMKLPEVMKRLRRLSTLVQFVAKSLDVTMVLNVLPMLAPFGRQFAEAFGRSLHLL